METKEEIVYKVVCAYDGTAFSGFQSQAGKIGGLTIQDVLEQKLAKVFAEPVSIRVAGRTDAKVHALAQVLSFRTKVFRETEVVKRALNGMLPDSIRVYEVSTEQPRFHARFTARSREYEYLIKPNSSADPFFRDRIMFVGRPLDIEAMRKGAAFLIGSHDFASFGSQVPKGDPTIRRMESISVNLCDCSGPGPFASLGTLVVINIRANAFLRRMVRMICGCLIKAGTGEWPPEKIKEILDAADPQYCAPPADPGGLYLKSVTYAQD